MDVRAGFAPALGHLTVPRAADAIEGHRGVHVELVAHRVLRQDLLVLHLRADQGLHRAHAPDVIGLRVGLEAEREEGVAVDAEGVDRVPEDVQRRVEDGHDAPIRGGVSGLEHVPDALRHPRLVMAPGPPALVALGAQPARSVVPDPHLAEGHALLARLRLGQHRVRRVDDAPDEGRRGRGEDEAREGTREDIAARFGGARRLCLRGIPHRGAPSRVGHALDQAAEVGQAHRIEVTDHFLLAPRQALVPDADIRGVGDQAEAHLVAAHEELDQARVRVVRLRDRLAADGRHVGVHPHPRQFFPRDLRHVLDLVGGQPRGVLASVVRRVDQIEENALGVVDHRGGAAHPFAQGVIPGAVGRLGAGQL